MSRINVSNLTFWYEGSYDNIFENVSFSIDTDWKLGFVGRNGKGKTTFLNLLLGKYTYEGSISSTAVFDYFPYHVTEEQMHRNTIELLEELQPDYEFWKVLRELDLLKTDQEVLYRPFETLSHGERTRVMLALLFARDGHFLLIDEPTNHLDSDAREVLREYLNQKKGFLLVSHDRRLLDACIDHILVLNRSSITVEKGNFSSWWANKEKKDEYERAKNKKLKGEIRKLEASARKTAAWAEKIEGTKIGFDPIKEHERSKDTRAYIGEKSKRMQQRRKNLQQRQQKAAADKAELLKDIEEPVELKLTPLIHHKEVYVRCRDLTLAYGSHEVISGFHMELKRGERIILRGRNGCGKSSLMKAILNLPGVQVLNGGIEEHPAEPEIKRASECMISGILEAANGLKISYINQDTSHLKGNLNRYIEKLEEEESLFKAVLRQLDFDRVQFEKNMEEYSEGQKKKVLIAGSLLKPAHLYIWDEPMNYVDIFSRMQIEGLIRKYCPTMLAAEHDTVFAENVGAQVIKMSE